MERIYFDNSSTSFPKFPNVAQAMAKMMETGGFNINRGTYSEAYALENSVFDTRELLCSLFNFEKASNVVFTPGITYSLNYIMRGFLKPGDHVITSSMEHNAVMRPLVDMQKEGVEFSCAECNEDGSLDLERVEQLVKPNTRAIIMLHGSNVCGTLLPLEEIGKIAKAHGLKFIVDSAQTAGVFPIDMKKMGIDVLCFTGHKSLRGPQGIGGFLISDEMVSLTKPIIIGGTGSFSNLETIPDAMPDRFESGTMNLPGIVGLHEALSYLKKENMDFIREKELKTAERFYLKARELPFVRCVGKDDFSDRAPIVSLDFKGRDNAEIAFLLESQYGVMTRCGLHCAPRAHKTLGTYPEGTVRFSFSSFNTDAEVDLCIDALINILK